MRSNLAASLRFGLTAATFAALVCAVDARSAPDERRSLMTRAQLWSPTDIPAMDLVRGPAGSGAFPFRATVHCTYRNTDLSGSSPKFACAIDARDEVKVKFGGGNGEVYAEVAGSRLLWALGFGADHMYPVRVVCDGCPRELYGTDRGNGEFVFDPAAIERKMPGTEISDEWSWEELDEVNGEAGGASRAHRDALKLMAVLLQHTDTKPEQQRLICLDVTPIEAGGAACSRPFLLINDLGLTFGRANTFNSNVTGGMNLAEWSRTPVWKDATRCVGNLPRSFTGTLDNPVISEAGRAFLAGLLVQLTDRQLNDLFATARVTLRVRAPDDARSGFPTIDEWVATFKAKRDEIVNRRCA
jgi:hypothetical protein